jgi:hypothetical protein
MSKKVIQIFESYLFQLWTRLHFSFMELFWCLNVCAFCVRRHMIVFMCVYVFVWMHMYAYLHMLMYFCVYEFFLSLYVYISMVLSAWKLKCLHAHECVHVCVFNCVWDFRQSVFCRKIWLFCSLAKVIKKKYEN